MARPGPGRGVGVPRTEGMDDLQFLLGSCVQASVGVSGVSLILKNNFIHMGLESQ